MDDAPASAASSAAGRRRPRAGGCAAEKLAPMRSEDDRPAATRRRPLCNQPPGPSTATLDYHRPRRRRIGHLVALSCLVASSSATDPDPPREKVCAGPGPRIVPYNFQCHTNPNDAPAATSPRVAPQLGDGLRSAEASGQFFDSLDADGDGAIEPEEMAQFLREEIGGQPFDTQGEVDAEVGTIMERLDRDRSDGLEMADMIDYWMQLEKLLSPEEVAEWIVYSVQLPSSVGKIFLENGITGYDFLEIVDNGGKVLQQELGIDKESFRNKIVRQMQARMLGIGSSPGPPQKFVHKLESCKAVSLQWEPSTARVFPVHSYRIQRRAIDLFDSGEPPPSDEVSVGAVANSSNNFDPYPNSDWKTVYVGGEQEYVDKVEYGHTYQYRIQAWNSVGRSGWESIDLTRALKKQRCSTKPSQRKVVAERGAPASLVEEMGWEWLSLPKRVVWGVVAAVQFIYHSVRFVFAIFALLAGVMRYRRAAATSSAHAAATLPFVGFWKAVNRLSKKVIGAECIPRTMLGDRDAILRQEQLHDDQMNATGLRGYDRLRKKSEAVDRRSALKKVKSHSTGDLGMSTVTFDLPTEISVPKENGTPNKFAWMRPTHKRNGTASFSISESSNESASLSPTVLSKRSKGSKDSRLSKSDHPSLGSRSVHSSQHEDEDNRCSECDKKFRIGKRYKHHCSRCMATFCHKHGRTTHNNFTSCKVPGDCICNSCLKVLSERSERSGLSRR